MYKYLLMFMLSKKICVWLKKEYGFESVFAVKTNHAGLPKEKMEDLMDDYPSGSHLVMEANVDGELIYFVGYKYNCRKVLCFVCSNNAGSFSHGDPYIARFPDKNGNVNKRAVPRPSVLSDYFKVSNKVDIHNQLRQYCLKLEKCWVAQWYVKSYICFLYL